VLLQIEGGNLGYFGGSGQVLNPFSLSPAILHSVIFFFLMYDGLILYYPNMLYIFIIDFSYFIVCI
jgi:hypothetical protein